MAGVALAIASALILRGRALPRNLGYLGILGAALLVFVYVGRLVILNPKSPGLHAAAVLSGFIVNPVWYIWLGWTLWRDKPA